MYRWCGISLITCILPRLVVFDIFWTCLIVQVVEERWGSLASLTNSVAVQRAAHANAHMHAKRDRTRKADDRVTDAPQAVEGRKGEEANAPEDEDDRRIRTGSRDYLKDVKAKDNRMREPQVDRKLSWRSKGSIRPEDAALLRAAAQTYNKFSDDGDFLKNFGSSKPQEEPNTSTRVSTVTRTTARVETTRTVKAIDSRDVKSDTGAHMATVSKSVTRVEAHSVAKDASASSIKSSYEVKSVASTEPPARMDAHQAGRNNDMEPPSSRVVDTERKVEGSGVQVQNLSSNQIAAKVMQLRLRGKHKEADELQVRERFFC